MSDNLSYFTSRSENVKNRNVSSNGDSKNVWCYKKTISVEPKVIFLFFMKEIELYYPDSQSTK